MTRPLSAFADPYPTTRPCSSPMLRRVEPFMLVRNLHRRATSRGSPSSPLSPTHRERTVLDQSLPGRSGLDRTRRRSRSTVAPSALPDPSASVSKVASLGGLAPLGLRQGRKALAGEGPTDGRDADSEAGRDVGGAQAGVECLDQRRALDGGTRAPAGHPGGLQAAVHGGARAAGLGGDARARPAAAVQRHHVGGVDGRRFGLPGHAWGRRRRRASRARPGGSPRTARRVGPDSARAPGTDAAARCPRAGSSAGAAPAAGARRGAAGGRTRCSCRNPAGRRPPPRSSPRARTAGGPRRRSPRLGRSRGTPASARRPPPASCAPSGPRPRTGRPRRHRQALLDVELAERRRVRAWPSPGLEPHVGGCPHASQRRHDRS